MVGDAPRTRAAEPTETSPLLTTPPATPSRGGPPPGRWLATVRLVLTSGSGLVADGYDLTVITMALAILTKLYPAHLTSSDQGLIASITLVGVILGQLSFGAVADIVGRKVASIMCAMLTIGGALLSACVHGVEGNAWSLGLQLTLCRFVLGLGIGGEYPLSAAISKEVGPESDGLCLTRAQLLVMNMLMFNVGMLIQAVLVLVLLYSGLDLELVWRVAVAAGAVPSTIAFILRLCMEEPEVMDLDGVVHEKRDGNTWLHDFKEIVTTKGPVLLGACLSWAVFNFVAYGEGTFSAIIAEQMLGASSGIAGMRVVVMTDAKVILLFGTFSLLGCLVGFALESRMTRCNMQLLGFACLAIGNWLDGGLLHVLSNNWAWVLVVIYALSSAANSIVGITTYLVATESFPAISRGTCVGIAAASGKVGAAIGTGIFPVVEDKFGLSWLMTSCGFMMVMGFGITWMLTPVHCSADEKLERSKDV